MIRPWRVLQSAITFKDQWLTLRTDRCRNGAGVEIDAYHVIEYPDWVNIAAFTGDGRIVLVREYRHGVGKVLRGLPSGTVDSTDPSAEAAARRELLEETGFAGDSFTELGAMFANPARQINRMSTFLAHNVTQIEGQSLDPNEEIEVVLEDFDAFLQRLKRREIGLSVSHVASLHLAVSHILADPAPDREDLRKAARQAFLPA